MPPSSNPQPLPLASAADWSFRDATRRSRWRPAVVPGCVHRDLLRHGLIPDPFFGTNELDLQWIGHHDWEYRADFTIPADLLAHEVIELVADGLDTVAHVELNGKRVGATDNMFVAHRWNVKPLLRAGRNRLLVRFASAEKWVATHRLEHTPREFNDPVGGCTRLRKQQCQFGWDWGPRLVTAGIWRDIRLEAWNTDRIEHVRIAQHHHADGTVRLTFTPLSARRRRNLRVVGDVRLDDTPVAAVENGEATIAAPRLWWPNGHGEQPLYTVRLEVITSDGTSIGRWERRIGLRTLRLDRHPDTWGESFQFVLNGRPAFAKGANWIPAHSFVAGLTRADYARDLTAAAEAHMNMIRVWGGDIYESEDFYDLCDELGLLVWQDFMFACTLYPADRAFLRSVRTEAIQQVRRLDHRACLALWCGNNELSMANPAELQKAKLRRQYEAIFHKLLPEVVAAESTGRDYWPSSPWHGDFEAPGDDERANGIRRGDTHFWGVWHAREPVKNYEKWPFRFCSEFGMQSYSSPETNRTFAPPGDDNVFGPVMENHQKNRAGNQIILDYVSRRYRFPKDQDALIYLSQLNQAMCMQIGVEYYRRNMPRCMGALYWQLNDCWPVASWSSIEFTGRWKALHYLARRFFAPAIVSAHVPGDETVTIGNYRRTSVREVHLYTVSDLPDETGAVLRWDLFHLDGRRLRGGRRRVRLRYGEALQQVSLDLARDMARHGRDNIVLRIALDIAGKTISEDGILLTRPRFMPLPKARTRVRLERLDPRRYRITFVSDAYQHRFAFAVSGMDMRASDNWFDLFPHEPKVVDIRLPRPLAEAQLMKRLTWRSLVDASA